MIQCATLAVIMVASVAPTIRKPALQDDEGCDDGQHAAVVADLPVARAPQRLAGDVVHRRADDEEAQRRRHRLPRRAPGMHARVDQHLAGVGQVERDEQRHAAHPGPVALPIEPVQVLWQVGRRHQVLLRVVEPPAVHGPQLAIDSLGLQLGGAGLDEVVVQPDEVERRADPGDDGDDVQPTQQQVGPVEQVDVHERW
jgi:hypothetical protein